MKKPAKSRFDFAMERKEAEKALSEGNAPEKSLFELHEEYFEYFGRD